jgi:hypothetical protein
MEYNFVGGVFNLPFEVAPIVECIFQSIPGGVCGNIWQHPDPKNVVDVASVIK